MNIKKFRVLWNEKTNSIPESTCSNIKYSFDGVSWIDCSDYINVVKTSQNIGNYGATTTDNIDDTFVDAAKSTESIEFLKDKSNWLIIGNDDLADKFGVDNITMEDFVNGELGEYSEGAKTAEKR
jgi:hypothetical protein